MVDGRIQDDEPCYVISVAAKLVSLHPQTLRYYEKIGLLKPSRTAGRTRLYSQRDVKTLRKITRLTVDLGVNLAGVEVVLNMSKRIEELQNELASLQRQLEGQIRLLQRRMLELETTESVAKEDYGIIEVTPINRDQESSPATSPEGGEGQL